MGMSWFRLREIVKKATRKCGIRRIGGSRSKKQLNLNANDDAFYGDYALAA